jgi:hypothetical protein
VMDIRAKGGESSIQCQQSAVQTGLGKDDSYPWIVNPAKRRKVLFATD